MRRTSLNGRLSSCEYSLDSRQAFGPVSGGNKAVTVPPDSNQKNTVFRCLSASSAGRRSYSDSDRLKYSVTLMVGGKKLSCYMTEIRPGGVVNTESHNSTPTRTGCLVSVGLIGNKNISALFKRVISESQRTLLPSCILHVRRTSCGDEALNRNKQVT